MHSDHIYKAVILSSMLSVFSSVHAQSLDPATAEVARRAASTIDAEAIAKASAVQAKDLKSFGEQVQRRMDQNRAAATQLKQSADANIARNRERLGKLGGVDKAGSMTNAMLDAQAAIHSAEDQKTAPQLFAFVSLSMPPVALLQITKDVTRVGGHVVLRGFVNGSLKDTYAALAKVFVNRADALGIGIDPRLFRAYQIQSVPTYVVTVTSPDLCDGLDCVSLPPLHDKISGNVTLDYALNAIATGRGAAFIQAKSYLHVLEKRP